MRLGVLGLRVRDTWDGFGTLSSSWFRSCDIGKVQEATSTNNFVYTSKPLLPSSLLYPGIWGDLSA